jgi:hypothetical protein
MRVPGADFEIEIVLAIARRGSLLGDRSGYRLQHEKHATD